DEQAGRNGSAPETTPSGDRGEETFPPTQFKPAAEIPSEKSPANKGFKGPSISGAEGSETGDDSRELCSHCLQSTCEMTPWGRYCRLSNANRKRWGKRHEEARREAERDISEEERQRWATGSRKGDV